MDNRRLKRLEIGLRVAEAYASLSTCPRRQVGCLISDSSGRPLSVGYNGVPSGRPHCTTATPCPGAGLPSGQGLDLCEALHAEQNAILQLRDPERAAVAFVTTFPCNSCMKLLLGTQIRLIVFRSSYPHTEGLEWWTRTGREVIQVSAELGNQVLAS